MVVYTYDFDGSFFKNPVAKFCLENLKKQLPKVEIKIFSEKDLPMEDCAHSKLTKKYQFKVDQIRMKMAADCKEDCLTVDGDVFFPDIKEVIKHKNTVWADTRFTSEPYINNGIFMYTSRRNEWVKYYYDLYNIRPEELCEMSNMQVFEQYPHKGIRLNTTTKCLHWYISKFNDFKKRYPNATTIYYSFNPPQLRIPDKVYWKLSNCDTPIRYLDFEEGGSVFFFETLFSGLDQKEAFELWKQQMCYTYQKDLKFEELYGEEKD